MERDRAAEQLSTYKEKHKKKEILTTATGNPIGDKLNSLTVGPRGPQLLQDVTFLEEMAHFNRERIPERVVHAKGAAAFGYFVVTHDITKYCKAKLFSEIGKRTPVAVRFSLVAGESGTADTVRDTHGFAVKFYTEDGNWDLVGNNSPIFFIRDSFLFPSFSHSQRRNPVSNLTDYDAFWDFISLRPETTHQVSFVFSDRGIPDGFRHMNGFGINTFKLVNAEGEAVYCKFHFKTDQGIKNLFAAKAQELAGSDPDYAVRDLYNAIESGQYPSYTFYIQVMTYKEAKTWKFNPFDATKVWPNREFPLIQVGSLVLNKNPRNFFVDVEQLAFCPANLVPGIEPSPDKILQGRLFAYSDTQRHRLGTNFLQLPVNSPFRTKVRNYERDGPQSVNDNQDGAPNYYPNSFGGPVEDPAVKETAANFTGDVDRYNSQDEDNFSQPRIFYRQVLDEAEKGRLVENIVQHLGKAKNFIQERTVRNFSQVDENLGRRLREGLEKLKARTATKIQGVPHRNDL